MNGEWLTDENGVEYFATEDIVGCSEDGGNELGPCIQVHSGTNKLQGRISAKVYVVLLCATRPDYVKRPIGCTSIDVRDVVKGKRISF